MADDQQASDSSVERRKIPHRQSSMGLKLMPEAVAPEFGPPPPPRRETGLIRLFIFLPLFLGAVATLLFYLQGGKFGSGKLHYDPWIQWLLLPGDLISSEFPQTKFPVVDLIWIPAVINAFIFGCLALSIQLLRKHEKVSV
ncbi:MAG: hypothetical protein ACM3JB_24100 [Acidobacteriaceae bacterium]